MANMFFVRIDVLSDFRPLLMLSLTGPLQLCPYPCGRLDLHLICALLQNTVSQALLLLRDLKIAQCLCTFFAAGGTSH
jgi:hypothetical protein